MEWTREKTLNLINEYRKRRGLWDMTHDDYRKKEMKQKLLMEVSASLGGNIAIVEIEKKFHTLRTQYHREISRIKRKEPYNSKWFGFKNLQFLSSPKACRSNKSRIKSEITEEGTVTKYILRDAKSDNSVGSANSSGNIAEEFILPCRSTTISYDISTTTSAGSASASASAAAAAAAAAAASRTRDLEKLIEETTKDVEDIQEVKPKVMTNEVTVPTAHYVYNPELSTTVQEVAHHQQDQPHEHHQQMTAEITDGTVETLEINETDGGITYHQTNGNDTHNAGGSVHHHGPLATRIIKVQRREPCHEESEEFFEETQPQQAQSTLIHSATKRIYFDANGHQHTATILTSPSNNTQTSANSTLITSMTKSLAGRSNTLTLSPAGSVGQSQQTAMPRDEFTTYGEYVSNEMRGITNREILIALKHKINVALFEASMAELQQK